MHTECGVPFVKLVTKTVATHYTGFIVILKDGPYKIRLRRLRC